jgi:hypothetical protein
MFHLRRSDYSRWFRDAIRDSYLADQAERIERRMDLTSSETRVLILELIRARYTLDQECLHPSHRAERVPSRCRRWPFANP